MINDFRGQYRFLSNFYPAIICYEKLDYASSENAYQAAKSDDLEYRKRFQWVKSSEAKQMGKLVILRPEFEETKRNIMLDIVRIKFNTHQNLAKLLLVTGDEELQEGNWWGDKLWGTVNGEGENWLGKILMLVRAELAADLKEKEDKLKP
jgi:ribA/ribD-fused uncharacterized protein